MDNAESQRFDLTTIGGLKEVEKFVDSPIGIALFPTMYLAKKLVGYLNSPSDVSPEKQADAAARIIEAARKNGARRVRFKVDKSVGAKVKGNVSDSANVEARLGVDGKMELDVEF